MVMISWPAASVSLKERFSAIWSTALLPELSLALPSDSGSVIGDTSNCQPGGFSETGLAGAVENWVLDFCPSESRSDRLAAIFFSSAPC